jgi:hypothetical protein
MKEYLTHGLSPAGSHFTTVAPVGVHGTQSANARGACASEPYSVNAHGNLRGGWGDSVATLPRAPSLTR